MRNRILNGLLVFVLLISSISVGAQSLYTPYDELPGIIKSYKPIYRDYYPDWGKKLYEYPVNAHELDKAFEAYMAEHSGKKSPIVRYYKIWRRVVSSYVNSDGEIVMPNIEMQRKALYDAQLNADKERFKKAANNSDWTFLGPKETYWLNESNSATAPKSCPWQVNVYAFDVSRSNNDILYCGTETGIVNKTSDNGLTWEQLGKNYPFGGGVSAVLVHPENPDVVYVAAGNQIHKTVDGGITWVPMLSSGALFSANRLKVDPNNSEKIIAAANSGIYITNNGGDVWLKKTSFRTWDVDIKPDDSKVVYGLHTNGSGNFEMSISLDGGATFSSEAFPSDIPDGSGGLLAVTPAEATLLECVMLSADDEGTPYLYKGTFDNNTTTLSWEKHLTGKTSRLEMNNGQGYFDLVLEISPTNPYIMFVGTTTFFKTVNGGISFSVIGGYWGNFAIHPDIQDMVMLPSGMTWVATDGGFSYTTDFFTSTDNYFSRNNGIVGSDMWGFDQGWNEDIIVGGRYHNGNTAIADFYGDKALRMGGAESPTGWVIHGKSRHVAFNDLGNGWVLPKTAEGPPEGRFIFSKFPNMVEYGGRRSNLLHHPNYYEIIYVGEGTGFWESNDMGQTFDLKYTFPGEVRYMEISLRNPKVLFADIVGKGLYKSEDGGESWIQKPSLTAGSYGTSAWNGKLFFALSPSNENVIYACLSNGAWSADIGKVFKSVDGGDSWNNITGSVSEYLKSIVIQPDALGQDLLYLFTTSKNGQSSNVYFMDQSMSDWEDFGTEYPAGMDVNRAMPFFRDSKIRVGGSASVWETPMAVEDFYPFIIPWVGKPEYNCCEDTIQFDDHSILNHDGASWEWSISPEPAYISSANIRNPRVVLGEPGTYTVTLEVTKDGKTYMKRINDMVSTTSCPSLYDCSNPVEVPKDNWEVLYVDSEEVPWKRFAENAIDGDDETFWHTSWSQSSPVHPHEIQVDMDTIYEIHTMTVMQRQSSENGRIDAYEIYVTDTLDDWGSPVSVGNFENSTAPQVIHFDEPVLGRYFRVVALSEVNDNAWASIAEISLNGCYLKSTDTTGIEGAMMNVQSLKAFPVPANDFVSISLPGRGRYAYRVCSMSGQIVEEGESELMAETLQVNLGSFKQGIYLVMLRNEAGTLFRVKVMKE